MSIRDARVLMTKVLGVAAVLAASLGMVAAQIPDDFKNLKVLPKDISKRELINVMRAFSGALGYRCHNCHVGEPGPSLDGYDFVSDENKHKLVARDMMKMVADINGKYIAAVNTGHDPKIEVSCRTCHHGQALPQTLTAVLEQTYEESGAEAALAKYRDLHDNYYGRDSFDFGEFVLDDLAGKWVQAGKAEDATALVSLHAETHDGSSHLETLLGEIQRASGNMAGAKAHYEKALKLNPQNRMAKHRLNEMKED